MRFYIEAYTTSGAQLWFVNPRQPGRTSLYPNLMPNIPRLTTLAQLLSQPLPANHTFDLGPYYTTGPCGSVCCALGLAAISPVFQAQGLTLSESGVPLYQNTYGIEAASLFFSLPPPIMQHLFWPFSYRRSTCTTPKQVARRIRQFIKVVKTTAPTPTATALSNGASA